MVHPDITIMRLTRHSKPVPFPFLPSAIIVLAVISISVLLLSQCVATHGRRVLSGSWDKTLILWNVDSGKEVYQFRGHTEGTYHTLCPKLQALVYDILPSTTAVFSYATEGALFISAQLSMHRRRPKGSGTNKTV